MMPLPHWKLLTLLALASGITTCLCFGQRQEQTSKPSVVLITIDTLRADRLARQPHSITPSLDAFLKDSIRFTRAMVQVPITLPSHVSILTGSYPIYHGIRDFGGIKLKEERETLAEILKANRFLTAAFVSSFALDSTWGVNQGFQKYHDEFDLSRYRGIGFNAVERRGDETMDLVIDWLQKQDESPFFLWAHLFDPHDPYTPPSPYKERFPSSPYDGEVAFADAQAGRLLDALRRSGRYDPSLIIVMGDHGEGLGEHGEETHGFFVYNSTLHVPLIIKLPDNKSKGTIVPEVVQSIDVAPTILQVLRLPRGREMQGRGLLGLIYRRQTSEESRSYAESFYARYHFGWSSLTSFQDSHYKFIRAPRKEFYDLRSDPGERKNLYKQDSTLAEQYNSLLKQILARYKNRKAGAGDLDQKHEEMDPETRQRLQSLGYITLSGDTHPEESDLNRADPKDKIELFSKVRRATIASEKGRLRESIQLLSDVIHEDPGIFSARYLQGFNDFQTARYRAAAEEFKAALKLSQNSANAVHALAMCYQHLGQDEDARTGFDRLIQIEPSRPRGYVGLGRIALKNKRIAEAEKNFRKAVKLGDLHTAPLGLGRVLVIQNKLDEALARFEEVARRFPSSPEAHLLLAYVYQRKGLLAESRKHQEIYQRLTRGKKGQTPRSP